MLNKDIIDALQSIKEEYYISDIYERSTDDSFVLHIPIDRLTEKAKNGFISRLQVENLVKHLSAKFSKSFEIIYNPSEKLEQLVEAVETILKVQFGSVVEASIFTFLSAERVNAWLKVQNIDVETKVKIEEYLKVLFAESDVNILEIQWDGELMGFPSVMEILIAVKRLQPISIENFLVDFNQDFSCIEDKWLNRQLDKLIKKDLIVRDPLTKKYTLTWKGLDAIPNITNNSNSDIKRALSLGRRKW